MGHRFLWITVIGILVFLSGSLIHQTATGQSGDAGIKVSDADAIYTPEPGTFSGEHLAAPALPSLISLFGTDKATNFLLNTAEILTRPNIAGQWRIALAYAHKAETIKMTNQILERPASGLSERIIIRGAAHIKTHDFRQPFVEPTPIPTPTVTALPTDTPVPPTATSMPIPTATDAETESDEADEFAMATDTPAIITRPTAIRITPTAVSIPDAVGLVEKYACGKAWGYDSESNLKNYLLSEAKRAAVNELFGEQITSFTKLENFKLTKDIVTALSAGSVRVSGTPDYYNGDDFAQACVSIVAYVTEADRAKFTPKNISSGKVCDVDGNATFDQLRESVANAALLRAVQRYNNRLANFDPEIVRGLLRNAIFTPDSTPGFGFDPEKAAYCTEVTGEVWPIEAMALLNGE